MNDVELELNLPENQNWKLKILMCKNGTRAVVAAEYYRTKVVQAVENTFAEEMVIIKKHYKDQLRQKDQAIARLRDEKKTALASAEEFAVKLAEPRLNQMSELNKEAYKLFLKGEIDLAIATLDDAKIEESVKKVNEEAAQSYLLKARLYTVKFRFKMAENYYQKAIEKTPNALEPVFEYAMTLQKRNQFRRARVQYQKAREIAEKSGDQAHIATLMNNIGVLYDDLNDFEAAEKAYARALELYEKLARTQPETYLPDVAMTLNNLGTFYDKRNDFEAAEKAYARALEIREKLARTQPETYEPDVAMTLNNLGTFYDKRNDFEAAEKAYARALEIREKLARTQPETYEPDVAMTLNNLGTFYDKRNDFEAAEKAYARALELYEKLARTQPETYLPYVATTQNNLGNFYDKRNDFEAAEKAYARALELYEKLARTQPETYLPYVATTQNNLGTFYYKRNEFRSCGKGICARIGNQGKTGPDTARNIFALCGDHAEQSGNFLLQTQ